MSETKEHWHHRDPAHLILNSSMFQLSILRRSLMFFMHSYILSRVYTPLSSLIFHLQII